MTSFFESLWYRINDLRVGTWQWFNGLNREEWLVVLGVTCVCGFVSLLGFHARRL